MTNRDDERAAGREAGDRLRSRGITVHSADTPEDLGELLDAVERFEAAVERHGGDLMMDDLKSSRPDDPHFVLPPRREGEAIRTYLGRIEEATSGLRHHKPRPD